MAIYHCYRACVASTKFIFCLEPAFIQMSAQPTTRKNEFSAPTQNSAHDIDAAPFVEHNIRTGSSNENGLVAIESPSAQRVRLYQLQKTNSHSENLSKLDSLPRHVSTRSFDKGI
jgi:hypothetical protein